ncbi:hypothetical protein [Hymenobacter latericus]|uniref:hypothetical protein n=1 Tax=Hymenobacter sp. YIM 151858-1 TaxID=2987688 RepID=UPI002227FC45|nr:hypothetical protein [Hymenobacter sp. YIM 151858-1]UYZ61147.1 hypothetical protein OIS50_19450 [Hymenobacter sp. YIM 151858-1]
MLFTGFTWSQFFSGTLVLLALYYAYVGWRYFRPELLGWKKRPTAGRSPQPASAAAEPLIPPSLVFAPEAAPAESRVASPASPAEEEIPTPTQYADNEASDPVCPAVEDEEIAATGADRFLSNCDHLHQNVIYPVESNHTHFTQPAGAPLTPADLPPPHLNPEALPAEQELPVAPAELAYPAEADSLIGADDLLEALDCLAAGRAPDSLHPALEGTALAARFAANKRRRSAEIDALFGEE